MIGGLSGFGAASAVCIADPPSKLDTRTHVVVIPRFAFARMRFAFPAACDY
jgi:hypothetical protein